VWSVVDTDRGKQEYFEKSLSQYLFFHQNFHMDRPEIEFDLRCERLATDGLNPISAINDRRLSACTTARPAYLALQQQNVDTVN
jgi:hypothetical protein